MACVYPTHRTPVSPILTLCASLQKCHITAHSLLGMHKNNMDALLRSMNLADRVTYVRGDPSYVSLTSSFLVLLSHHCRTELSLNYSNDTFDMVRLSYCSLSLAETEVRAAL
jgi:hypothetical protein